MGGIEMPDDEWNQIIQEVDANGDGRVTINPDDLFYNFFL